MATESSKNNAQITMTVGTLDGATAYVVVVPNKEIRLSVGWESRPKIFGAPIRMSRAQARVAIETLQAALDETEGN